MKKKFILTKTKKRRKKIWIFLRYFPSKKCHPSGGDDAWPTPNPTIELICHLTTAHHYIVRVCSEKKLDSLGKNVKLQHEMKNIFFLKIFKVCKLMRDGFFFQTDLQITDCWPAGQISNNGTIDNSIRLGEQLFDRKQLHRV